MKNYLKGIIVGLGGILPGLSGSVLLVIFGLYHKTINALGTLTKKFKENIKFLIPICLGMITGVILFSKLVDFLLETFEMQTRFCFLGLVIGTVPLFYKEVKKEGFSKKYYILIFLSTLFGLLLFMNKKSFVQVETLNLMQSIFLGVIVAGSSIVPGIDTTVILSSCGLYEAYINALSNVNLSVLLPLVIGLIFGALIISAIMNQLIKKHYTITFSIIFGFFISIIPSVLNSNCILKFNLKTMISIIMMLIGFSISYYLGKIEKNEEIS